ncbi:MAG: hypothetical protein Q4C49_09750 [Bacillota bacterium]|nr:hypothetical protein [Bacillota bacterium]
MKRIWNIIDKTACSKKTKNTMYISTAICINLLLGAILWIVLGQMIFPDILGLLCFSGYPAIFFGLFGGILFLYNHEFS